MAFLQAQKVGREDAYRAVAGAFLPRVLASIEGAGDDVDAAANVLDALFAGCGKAWLRDWLRAAATDEAARAVGTASGLGGGELARLADV